MGHEPQTGTSEPGLDAAPTPSDDEPRAESSELDADESYASDPQSALDAIDSVEQNAQSLIESAIDGLLDTDTTSFADTDIAAQDEEMSMEDIEALLAKSTTSEVTSGSALEDTTAQTGESELSDDLINAELDALDGVIEPAADDLAVDDSMPEDETAEYESNEDVLADAIDMLEGLVEDEPSADTDSEEAEASAGTDPAGEPDDLDASAYSDDDLLDEIASDLIDNSHDLETEPEDDPAEIDALTSAMEHQTPDLDSIDEVLSAIDEVHGHSPTESEASTIAPTTVTDEAIDTVLDSTAIDAASTLDDLDATLAGIGDDLLSGDFQTPDGEMIDSSTLEQHDASALLDQLNIDGLDLDGTIAEAAGAKTVHEETEAVQAEAAAPATNPQPVPSPAAPKPVPHTVAQTAVLDEPEIPEAESIWQTGYRLCTQYSSLALSALKTHGAPMGARAVLLVNKPIKDRPAQLKDSIGYLALWTLLMATILWVYLVFVRATPTPTPTQAPTRVLQPGEVVDPLRTADSQP